MKGRIVKSALILSIIILAGSAEASELTGELELESGFFSHTPQYIEQQHHPFSIALSGELYQQYDSGGSVTVLPFVRIDTGDQERSHFDLREMHYLYPADTWQFKAGISKVFWGATEFVHLVDIVNQTDLVEGLKGEEKLGQPMIHLSLVRNWGIVDAFLLPFFRERTYPGKEGRLRPDKVVDTENGLFESSAEQFHQDVALRYSNTIEGCDFGVYQFWGTSREPIFIEKPVERTVEGRVVPYYQQIWQTGVDVQCVQGEWLWKGEALYRTGQERGAAAATFGFEYTLYNVFDTEIDMGFIGEYVFDDREESISAPYDNDMMFGWRMSFNDIDSSELLAGCIKDINHSSLFFTLEASRRLNKAVKIEIDSVVFLDVSRNDPADFLANEDFIRLRLKYFF